MKNYIFQEKELYDFVIRYKQLYNPEITQKEVIKIFNAFNSSQPQHVESLEVVLMHLNFIKKVLSM